MFPCIWLLNASFYVILAEAFYLFQPSETLPESAGAEDHSANRIYPWVHEKDSGVGRAKFIRLSMKRKAHPSHIHPHLWSAVDPSTIARRHPRDRDGESHKSNSGYGTPVKRTNKYHIVTAAQPKQTNSIAIDQDGTDFSYFSALEFGSRGKNMYMLIDTGTANTWVMGADCSSGQCSTHTTFGAQDSDTLQTTNTKFNLTYGTGTVSGVIVNDTVKMAGFSIPLSFGSASVVSDDFSWYPIDGILGLGRKAPDTVGPPTVMEAIKTNQLFTRNLVGINLQRNGDGSTDGELNFGSPDITKYTGNLSYTNTVSDKKRWEIPIDDASVNGVACKFSGKTAIIDTGTTFIILPPADAQRFHDLIPDSQRTGESFNIPCSSSLPVQIVISNMFYNISAKDYVGSPVTDQSTCSSNIIGKTTFGPDQWLLGDVFLKNVYTVLDFDGDRIGFGVKITAPQQTATSKALTTTSSSATENPSSSRTVLLQGLPPSVTTTIAAAKPSKSPPELSLTSSAPSSSTLASSSSSTPQPSRSALVSHAQGTISQGLRFLRLKIFNLIFVILLFY